MIMIDLGANEFCDPNKDMIELNMNIPLSAYLKIYTWLINS